ncbi:S24 family peptidase [Bordetella sp. 02P26C-1]|uniref:S24 family peptidase n=1 Tax=Bordetella sp. 02P26C-1 TaxID=2683195 RepID=UPI00135587A7|nr:S24 family peptidase [Bordetella sp. 02P26C-1]MVW80201.1 hypothetical protein [Bordetella sp. 02P26C-1]
MLNNSKPNDVRKQNLKYLIERFGQSQVAKWTGKPDRQLADMLAGRKSFGEKVARAMEQKWHETRGEIIELDSPVMARQMQEHGSQPRQAPEGPMQLTGESRTLVTIARYDTGGTRGAAGVELREQPGVIESWKVSREWLEKNLRGFSQASSLCIVTGFGDSMRPMFNSGDPLIVDSSVKSVEFDAVYFFRVGNEGFIKRLQRVPGKGLVAISENPAYRDWVVDETMDLEVFGRVLKVWRSEDF